MANDINLPNLASHLQINLADTAEVVAEAARQGSSVGAALGESLQRRVSEAVDDIPPVTLDANSTDLDRDLERVRRELAELSGQRIGVDISIEQALRSLDQLQPHLERLSVEHPDIEVTAATDVASQSLREILLAARHVDEEDVDIDVDVDTARPLAELAELERESRSLSVSLRGIGPALGALGRIGGLAGSAIPALASVVSLLEQIAPAAALGVTGVLGIASAVAAIKVGTSGVGAALKAAFAPAAKGGAAGAAAAGTSAVADAQRNLRDAVQQAAQAAAMAARQVGDAERDLADAQKTALDAQKALTSARQEATRQLQDQNNSLADAKLAERAAVLDVEDAEKQLAAVRAQGASASAEDQEKAQLAYDKAVQALKEQQLETSRLQADTDAANKAGVNGSQIMRDAQQKVADTTRDVSDRQRDLADAQANVQQTAQQSAEAIDRAREALEQAGQKAGSAAGGANAFAAAMAKLSPAAQEFVREIVKLRPSLDSLKLDVQQHLFEGLAAEVDRTASVLLPVFRRSLDESAMSLNLAGKGAAAAARDIGRDGTLGKALDGANRGLRALAGVPALVVTALGQIGAAAAPAFDRLTAKAAGVAKTISDKLNKSFQSGGLEKAIDTAVATLGDLAHVGGNVLHIIENILNPAHATGGGLLGILTTVSAALAKATATKGFQDALSALFGVMAEIGKTAGPLVAQALKDLEPVFTKLGPPAKDLVDALGSALSPVLDALSPLLSTAADGVGGLVEAALPLLPVVSKIIAGLGPSLQPILGDLVKVFRDLKPVVQDVATALSAALKPVLDALPSIIGPFADLVARNLVVALAALGQILVKNAPQLAELGVDLAKLFVAAGPLITAFTVLSTAILVKLAPAFIAILEAATRFGAYLVKTLSGVINNLIIPAIAAFTDILHGKFGAAWDEARKHASAALSSILRAMTGFPGAVASALAPLVGAVSNKAVAAANSLTRPVTDGVDDAVEDIGGLPGRAKHALGDLSGLLYREGADLIKGFVHGIESQFSGVKNTLGDLTGKLGDWKGPAELDAVLLTPAGRSLIQGFMDGIDAQVPALRAQLQGITGQLAAWGDVRAAVPSAGALAAAYAGSAAPAQGPITINLHGSEATPAAVASALSWQSKVGRR